MSRPRIVDAFPFNNELDILECRLVELYPLGTHGGECCKQFCVHGQQVVEAAAAAA